MSRICIMFMITLIMTFTRMHPIHILSIQTKFSTLTLTKSRFLYAHNYDQILHRQLGAHNILKIPFTITLLRNFSESFQLDNLPASTLHNYNQKVEIYSTFTLFMWSRNQNRFNFHKGWNISRYSPTSYRISSTIFFYILQ